MPARAVTEVTLYTADHPGLFSRIAGALALAGANIVDAKILTMSNGMALDTFWIQDREGGAFDRPRQAGASSPCMFENVLHGKLEAACRARRRRRRSRAAPASSPCRRAC